MLRFEPFLIVKMPFDILRKALVTLLCPPKLIIIIQELCEKVLSTSLLVITAAGLPGSMVHKGAGEIADTHASLPRVQEEGHMLIDLEAVPPSNIPQDAGACDEGIMQDIDLDGLRHAMHAGADVLVPDAELDVAILEAGDVGDIAREKDSRALQLGDAGEVAHAEADDVEGGVVEQREARGGVEEMVVVEEHEVGRGGGVHHGVATGRDADVEREAELLGERVGRDERVGGEGDRAVVGDDDARGGVVDADGAQQRGEEARGGVVADVGLDADGEVLRGRGRGDGGEGGAERGAAEEEGEQQGRDEREEEGGRDQIAATFHFGHCCWRFRGSAERGRVGGQGYRAK